MGLSANTFAPQQQAPAAPPQGPQGPPPGVGMTPQQQMMHGAAQAGQSAGARAGLMGAPGMVRPTGMGVGLQSQLPHPAMQGVPAQVAPPPPDPRIQQAAAMQQNVSRIGQLPPEMMRRNPLAEATQQYTDARIRNTLAQAALRQKNVDTYDQMEQTKLALLQSETDAHLSSAQKNLMDIKVDQAKILEIPGEIALHNAQTAEALAGEAEKRATANKTRFETGVDQTLESVRRIVAGRSSDPRLPT